MRKLLNSALAMFGIGKSKTMNVTKTFEAVQHNPIVRNHVHGTRNKLRKYSGVRRYTKAPAIE